MFSQDTVKYIAHLSRIHLNDDEIKRLGKNLEDILQYIDKLKKLDIRDIQPTSHVLPLKNVFREDKVRPSLLQKEVMDIAITPHEGSFKVPQVIE